MELYFPNKVLQPFIKRYMIMESEHGMRNTILPDTSIVMAFRYKGTVSYSEEGIENMLPSSVISGIRKSSRIIHYSRQAASLLIIFKDGGAAAFFKQPLHEISGLTLPVDDLLPIQDTENRLAEAHDNAERIAVVERFLLSQLKQSAHDALILNSIQKIYAANGDIRIKDILSDLPISRDPFEKRFRRMTGTSPKHFSTIVRLRHLIDHYSTATSLTEAAYTAGYFDQSHFIKDFRHFTRQTPHEFFKSPLYW
jgi:AraC-like DNA-binding protein